MIKNWNVGVVESWHAGLGRKRFSHYSIIAAFHYSKNCSSIIPYFKERINGTREAD
jgi:hypothetical protein